MEKGWGGCLTHVWELFYNKDIKKKKRFLLYGLSFKHKASLYLSNKKSYLCLQLCINQRPQIKLQENWENRAIKIFELFTEVEEEKKDCSSFLLPFIPLPFPLPPQFPSLPLSVCLSVFHTLSQEITLEGSYGTWSCRGFNWLPYWPSESLSSVLLYSCFSYPSSWNHSFHMRWVLSMSKALWSIIWGKNRLKELNDVVSLEGFLSLRCNHTYILLNHTYILL